MDPASRAVLDRTLLADRSPQLPKKVPYSVIMVKLRCLFNGAEETLRGHYRRLTKPPEQRVRKPVWEPNDILLLTQAVALYRSDSPKGRVSWTAVSDYIHSHGGSYRFGITTCSKKWKALEAQRAAR
ncbi:hypothetical protein CDD83_5779 [Cordyceps sp. RAO-2017]|nr:hypothetical protein CDD83_5779 [Cordyceps sp. RAO-2017]